MGKEEHRTNNAGVILTTFICIVFNMAAPWKI